MAKITPRSVSSPTPTTPLTFDVRCGVSNMARSFVKGLEEKGLYYDTEANLKLVVDVNRGFALHYLEKLSPLDKKALQLVVVTFSFCPEYWEDLWDQQPGMLIVDANYEHDYADALYIAANGGRHKLTPGNSSRLNQTERRILSHVAIGISNKQIAIKLAVQEKTIVNTLTCIYKKLNVENRTQASLYYWGYGISWEQVVSTQLRRMP